MEASGARGPQPGARPGPSRLRTPLRGPVSSVEVEKRVCRDPGFPPRRTQSAVLRVAELQPSKAPSAPLPTFFKKTKQKKTFLDNKSVRSDLHPPSI